MATAPTKPRAARKPPQHKAVSLSAATETIVAELRDFIGSLNGDWHAADAATAFVADMLAHEPDAFRVWSQSIVVDYVRERLSREVGVSRSKRIKSVFQDAVVEAEEGEPAPLGLFRLTFSIDELSTRRTLGKMTAADCLYAAGRLRSQSRTMAMTAAFLEAVAKKVGDKPVETVLTEQQLEKMIGDSELAV